MTLQIEQRTVADLIPYAANSRTHSDAQVAQIAASMAFALSLFVKWTKIPSGSCACHSGNGWDIGV